MVAGFFFFDVAGLLAVLVWFVLRVTSGHLVVTPMDRNLLGALLVAALNPVEHDLLVASVCFVVVALNPAGYALFAASVCFVAVAENPVSHVHEIVAVTLRHVLPHLAEPKHRR